MACGYLFRLTGYVLIALVAMLAFFQNECWKEEEAKAKVVRFDKFNPDVTDVETKLIFNEKGNEGEFNFGADFILKQSAPCALCKLITFFVGSSGLDDMEKRIEENGTKITIYDARKKNPGSFMQTGFTLIELDHVPDISDWRTNGAYYPDAEVTKFHKVMEPHLKKMYPKVKKIQWTHNVIRGGKNFGDQPIALGPHLDYHQDDAARLKYHKDVPPMVPELTNFTEPNILMGDFDTDEYKLGVLLGVWKPIFPEKICDHPLAVMDARTFSQDFLSPLKTSFNFLLATFNNLNGAIAHDPAQKWYYYSFQNTKEVLIFHQYTKGKLFANPHTSFKNRNCPEDTKSRMSVEFRVALYF